MTPMDRSEIDAVCIYCFASCRAQFAADPNGNALLKRPAESCAWGGSASSRAPNFGINAALPRALPRPHGCVKPGVYHVHIKPRAAERRTSVVTTDFGVGRGATSMSDVPELD